jgi:hypothetical protein
MNSREELLEAIAAARTLAQSYLVNADAFLLARIPDVVRMLDMMEERVRATPDMPEPDAFDDIPLGLYAVRELDEIDDDHRLSTVLCNIPYSLKHR